MKTQTSHSAAVWETRPFLECLGELGIERPAKLLARDYKPTGPIPVIDQGQQFIAGWTAEQKLAIRENLPFIVFGDHTRAFKFVNFPFALGADGTHLLKPAGAFNPQFFYYACLHLPLPDRGYNRHFTVLKEQSLPTPPKPEQEKIAAVLWKLQRAIEVEGKLVASTRDLKQSAMRQLFTHGLRSEPQKETAIGRMPTSWATPLLAQCCDVVSSSLSYTEFSQMPDAAEHDSVPAMGIKVSDMNLPGNELQMTRANLERRVSRALAERKLVPPSTVVFPKRGAAIATNKKRLTTAWTVLDPNLIGVRAGSAVEIDFLFQWFQQFDLKTITEPGPTPQLNKKNLTPLMLPVPTDQAEQREIAHMLTTIDRRVSVHERKRDTLQDLFQTMLDHLMTAQIRVDKLDIDTSEIQNPQPA